MKKILIILTFLFLSLPVFSMDNKTYEVRETYFKNEIQTYQNKIWGNLFIKGIWTDPKHNLNSVLVEELSCNMNSMICSSSVVDISFIGTPLLAPYLDVYGLTYKIIDYTPNKLKLFCTLTNYTVEINLKTQNVTKYKVFENGDVNKYSMIFDTNYAEKYFKTIIEKFSEN